MRLASGAASAPNLLFTAAPSRNLLLPPPPARYKPLLVTSSQNNNSSNGSNNREETSLENSQNTLKNKSESPTQTLNEAVVDSLGPEKNSNAVSRFRVKSLYAIRTGFIKALGAVAVSRFESSSDVASPESAEAAESWLATRTSPKTQQNIIDADLSPRRPELSSPGFSFSAAGFLFPYHLGVAQCLIDNGYIKDNTPLAGSSAGALVSAIVASNVSTSDAMAATKELAADCRKKGTAFRLGAVLREALETCLPEDAHIKSSGRIQVAVTQLFRYPNALLVSDFESREDMINALLTSCFIPGYFAPYPITRYRKRFCVDGGLTLFIPPTSADVTVRVCAFSASQLRLRGVGISPDSTPTRPAFSTRQLLDWALQPAADGTLDNFFEIGYQDAYVWVCQNQINSSKTQNYVATTRVYPNEMSV